MSQRAEQFNVDARLIAAPIRIKVSGESLPISYLLRPGSNGTLVYLHGLGSSKSDFAPALGASELDMWTILAYDAPGSGDTPYPTECALAIDDLVELAASVIRQRAVAPVVVVGHSMGGLTGLLLAHRHPDLVSAFINVEGNLGSVDCGVFSRRAVAAGPEEIENDFFPSIQSEFARSGLSGLDVFAERFRSQVSPRAFHDYCRSIVEYSDDQPLFEYFVGLDIPRLYVYGSENRHLPHPSRLLSTGVCVEEIPSSNHFPLYSNPASFLHAVASFINATDRADETSERATRSQQAHL